jgi:psiF repeat-containing protein
VNRATKACGFSEPAIRIIRSSDARGVSCDVNVRVAADIFVRPHSVQSTITFKEIVMKTLYALTLAALVAVIAPVASADDATAAKPRPAKVQTAVPRADAPAVPAKISQQEKMRQCAKQATGKKGDERKAFMKSCLSKKKA